MSRQKRKRTLIMRRGNNYYLYRIRSVGQRKEENEAIREKYIKYFSSDPSEKYESCNTEENRQC